MSLKGDASDDVVLPAVRVLELIDQEKIQLLADAITDTILLQEPRGLRNQVTERDDTVLVESPGASSLGQDRSPSLVKANLGVQYRSPYRIDVSGAAYFLSAQTWTLREFDASGTVVPVDDPIPARLIATARVAGRPFADDDLEISLVGWNLAGFATRYREHPKGQRLAPRVFGAVSYRF